MSAIAAIYHRDRSRVDDAEVRKVMRSLAHRGPDGQRVARVSFATLGHQHHWTTPEEVGERQPVLARNGRCQLSFDGRLDNRAELRRQLGDEVAVDGTPSDARLVLRAFERWGEGCFERLEGPFAVVVLDPLRRRLTCARDALGSRTIFYHATDRLFVAASEEVGVLAHPAIAERPDPSRLACHLALRVPEDGRTFFQGVTELLPGELLVVDERRLRRRRFRRPRPVSGLDRLSDADCAERFGELLDRSVSDRLRAVGAPSVLMSGGLDSTSVAALAARRLRASGRAPAQPVSWVFDELRRCDERRFIEPVCRALGVAPIELRGDRCWPLGAGDWLANPNTPEENPYRGLKELAYGTVARRGGRVLLTGGFGDQLWTGASWWLADLLAAGRPFEAAAELARELGRRRARALGGLRRALRLPALRRAAPAAWLSDEARSLMGAAGAVGPGAAAASRERERRIGLLGARNARSATIEIFHAARRGIELRHPFRDLRLVEFVLGLPAHQLYRRGRKKHLLRLAMAGLLPASVLARRRPTGLGDLYRRGVDGREAASVRRLLGGELFAGRMIEGQWLARTAAGSRSPAEELALWHLVASELWRRRHRQAGATDLRRTA